VLKAFLVEGAALTHHRPYLTREHGSNEPPSFPGRDTRGEQTIESGANFGWPATTKLKRDQLAHSP
jgi:hypothetical protein